MASKKKVKKGHNREVLGLHVEPMRLENRIYHFLTVIFGAVGVVLGVIITLGKFAEFFYVNRIPESVKFTVIACAVISIGISLVSGYLHSLHQLSFLHDSVKVLAKQIDLQRIFTFDVNEDRLASVAVKRAAAEYVHYISGLRHQIEHIDNPDSSGKPGTILKDWSLISVFVRQLINTLGETDCRCVWMGVSLVTNPEGWAAQNDVVYHFDDTIRHALGQEILDRVYRVYYVDPHDGDREQVALGLKQAIMKDHGTVGARSGKNYRATGSDRLRLHLSKTKERVGEIQDVSFVWINNESGDHKSQLPDPTWSIPRLRQEGWRLAVALEWVVRNNFLVDYVVIHSETEGWVGEHHRKLGELWEDSESIPINTPRQEHPGLTPEKLQPEMPSLS